MPGVFPLARLCCVQPPAGFRVLKPFHATPQSMPAYMGMMPGSRMSQMGEGLTPDAGGSFSATNSSAMQRQVLMRGLRVRVRRSL